MLVVVWSGSHVLLFAASWTAARQSLLSSTLSWSLLKLMSIELMMPSNHLILCHPLLFLPLIFTSISWHFSNEFALHIRWPKYWNFSFSISLVMDREAWHAAIHGVIKSWTWLRDWTELNLPWFMNLTFQVPIQYCLYSIKLYFYQKIHPQLSVILLWPSHCILSGGISDCLLLFPTQ